MAGLSIDGLISGFNTQEIIDAILDTQYRGPIKGYEERIATEVNKVSAYQTLSANLLGLGIASQSLGDTTVYKGKKGTSSNPDSVEISASNSASVGNFTIQVDNIAKANQISTDFFSSATEELGISGEFILNGRSIKVNATDTLSSLAQTINYSGAGASANVVQTSGSQFKLVITSNTTGVKGLDLRDVGTGNLLQNLTLTTNSTRYDYTVQANSSGAISNEYADELATPLTGAGSFQITDASGRNTITVNLTGTETLAEIRDAINTAASGTNISASITGSGPVRLQIESSAGIPTQFSDPNNLLTQLGVIDGIQSADFTSKTKKIGDMLNLSSAPSGTITIDDGEGQTINVAIDLKNNSLNDIKSAIEAAVSIAGPGTDIGVQILERDGVYRLEITGANGFNPIVTDDNNVLETLGFINAGPKNEDQKGENSEFRYNGVSVSRTTNIVSDLVDGVTLGLISESSSPVSLRIDKDVGDVTALVDDFVTAYNNIANFINEQTFYDASTQEKGLLFGDSTLREIQNQFASMLATQVAKLPSVKLQDLNDGFGTDIGKIKITDKSGKSAEIDLSSAQTVQDVITLINAASGIQVEASIDAKGRGLVIKDLSGTSLSQLKVEEVDGGTVAKDLGILGSTFSTSIYGSQIYEGGFNNLAEFGISLKTDGTITFDSLTFEQKLQTDPEAIQNLFTLSKKGIGDLFEETAKTMTFSSTGTVSVRIDSFNDTIENLQEAIDRFNERADKMEEVLRKKFSAMETSMAQSQNLSSLIAQRLNTSN